MNKDIKLYSSLGAKKVNDSLTPEERSAKAKKAAQTRWLNYKRAHTSGISEDNKRASTIISEHLKQPVLLTSRKCALCNLRFSSHETDEFGWANRGILKHDFVEPV